MFQQKAAQAGLAELDENQIKIMIIKLQQIEKLLKELGKDKKKRAKLGVTNAQLRKTRRNSTQSRIDSATGLRGVLKNAISQKKFSAIEENDEANESDEDLLPRRRGTVSELQQMRGTGTSRAGRSATGTFMQ